MSSYEILVADGLDDAAVQALFCAVLARIGVAERPASLDVPWIADTPTMQLHLSAHFYEVFRRVIEQDFGMVPTASFGVATERDGCREIAIVTRAFLELCDSDLLVVNHDGREGTGAILRRTNGTLALPPWAHAAEYARLLELRTD